METMHTTMFLCMTLLCPCRKWLHTPKHVYIHTYTHTVHTHHTYAHTDTHTIPRRHILPRTHVRTSTYMSLCICRYMSHTCTHIHTSGTDYHNLLISSVGGGGEPRLEKLKVFLRSIVKWLPLALASPVIQESSSVAASSIFLYFNLDCILGNNVKQLTVKALLPQQNNFYNDSN